ncbi:MAG: hypothetical protein IOMNBAOH_00252 [Rhodocyclaceae bacterium]|nr:hypothetical protein [Rhodocyclaceae bacterium]
MLDRPLPSLDAWVTYFSGCDIPVLRYSVERLAALRLAEDSVSARAVARAVLDDPLLILRLFAHIEARRSRSRTTDITTVERAIIMLGTGPLFKTFESLGQVEEALRTHPDALMGALNVIRRAQRAASYALELARLRHDIDTDEIVAAAMLHDIAEVLIWIFAPKLALDIARQVASSPGLRSAIAQRAVLGFTYHDLQHALALSWRLPGLLIELTNDEPDAGPRVRNVMFAVDLARHSTHGWSDPAIEDDLLNAQSLVHLEREPLLSRLGIPLDALPAPVRL